MKTIRDLLAEGTITMETGVMGELPMTADGAIVGNGAQLWDIIQQREGKNLGLCLWISTECDDWSVDPSETLAVIGTRYSTREAAEKARGA